MWTGMKGLLRFTPYLGLLLLGLILASTSAVRAGESEEPTSDDIESVRAYEHLDIARFAGTVRFCSRNQKFPDAAAQEVEEWEQRWHHVLSDRRAMLAAGWEEDAIKKTALTKEGICMNARLALLADNMALPMSVVQQVTTMHAVREECIEEIDGFEDEVTPAWSTWFDNKQIDYLRIASTIPVSETRKFPLFRLYAATRGEGQKCGELLEALASVVDERLETPQKTHATLLNALGKLDRETVAAAIHPEMPLVTYLSMSDDHLRKMESTIGPLKSVVEFDRTGYVASAETENFKINFVKTFRGWIIVDLTSLQEDSEAGAASSVRSQF